MEPAPPWSLDPAEPRPQRAVSWTVALFVAMALALLFTGGRSPRSPPLLEGAWSLDAHLALPLAAAVLLDSRRRVGAMAWGVAAGLLALAPLVLRVSDPAMKEVFKHHPLEVLAVAVASLGLGLVGAWRGGVSLSRWGLGLGDWRWWAPRALGLLAVVALVSALLVMADPAFAAHYPDYKPARASVQALAFYIASLALTLVGWEFLFRGFMLFGVSRSASPLHAVLFQAVPFFLTHRSGPTSEFVASFFGAILLGAFCWRSRSFWPAPLLHWGMNAVVQVAAFSLRTRG